MKTLETKDIQVLPIQQFNGGESILQTLYGQIKDFCVDAFPHNTVLSFASAARFFGVVLLKGQQTGPAGRDVEVEAKVLRWQLGQDAPMTPSTPDDNATKVPAIGLVYLMDHGPSYDYGAESIGQVNIGVIIDPLYRGRRYAYQAVSLTLTYAFETINVHRVQALVVDSPIKNTVIAFFTQMRFNQEGTSRRSACRLVDRIWKDVTYLAILDHTWRTKPLWKPAPKSMWDELYARHQREREELLKWENKPKKSSSTEKLKNLDRRDKEKSKEEIIRAALEDDDDDYYYDEDEDGDEYDDDEADVVVDKSKGKRGMSAAEIEEEELERAIQLSLSDTASEASFTTGRATGSTGATIDTGLSSASSWDALSSDGSNSRL